MNRTLRRVLTTAGATTGALALFTGTAAAHYCYFDAPTGSQAAKGSAWRTSAETAAEFSGFAAAVGAYEAQNGLTSNCDDEIMEVVAQVQANAGALFMGPGLLGGGAVQQGKAPKRIAHLDFSVIDGACWAVIDAAESAAG